MDEMDHIQDATIAAQEKILAERIRRAQVEASIIPPAERTCDSCGCDIPAARLRLKPMTRFCVDCQAELEQPRR